MKNKILNITKIIALTLVIVAIISVSVLLATIKNNEVESVEANIVSANSQTEGFNGNVGSSYTSPYASEIGSYNIYDASTFNSFLTAAQSATASNPVKGYLTASFSYDEAIKGTKIQYAYLDGCGYTITLPHSDEVVNNSTANPFAKYEVYESNKELPSYNGVYMTPFGQQADGSFYTSGYLAGLAMYVKVENLNIVRSGILNYYYFTTTKGALYRPYSVGVLFGYTFGSSFNNCSMKITNKQYFSMQFAKATTSSYESVSTLCFGGYTGTFDGYNTTATVSNSSIELSNGGYLEGYSRGTNTGLWQANSARAFVGGMTGVLCNGAYMYNLTALGDGQVRTDADGPTYEKGTDRATFGGVICGSNYTDNGKHLYSTNKGLNSAASGAINGVIVSWTGKARQDVGSTRTGDYGGQDDYETYGTICGLSDYGKVTNVYYTMNKSVIENQDSSSDKAFCRTVGNTTGIGSGNFIDLKEYDYSSDTNVNKSVGSQSEVMYLYFTDKTDSANIGICYDVTKYPEYTSDSGMFVWNFTLKVGSEYTINAKPYEKTDVTNVEGTMNNRVYITETPLTRSASGTNAEANGIYGYAVKYRLNYEDDKNVNLGTVPYSASYGVSTPSIQLLSNNGSGWVRFNPTNIRSSYISKTSIVTYYTNSAIWSVFDKNSNIVHNLDYIHDAGQYEVMVYNGINNTTNTNYRYDFIDEESRIVSYKQDNTYYQNTTTKWQPRYDYTITPKVVTGSWKTVNNTVDNLTYTAPTNVEYHKEYVDFEYAIASSSFELAIDEAAVGMSYYKVNTNAVSATALASNKIYCAKVDDKYVLQGKTSDVGFGSYEEYYECVKLDHIQDAGEYIVIIGDIKNPVDASKAANYVIDSSVERSYNVTINPRQIHLAYSNLYNVQYSGVEKRATYAVGDNKRITTLVSSEDGVVTIANADIAIWNVLDSTAVVCRYPSGNDYINIGSYYFEITLATGSMSNNYLLPSRDYITTDHDTEEDLRTTYEVNANDKILKVIRSIEIKKIDLILVQEFNGGRYVSNLTARQFETLDKIQELNPDTFGTATISVDGVQEEVYVKAEDYTGYNSLVLGLMGVNMGEDVYEHVYPDIHYYKAVLTDGVYYKTGEGTKIAEGCGYYIAQVSFLTSIYKNYEVVTFNLLYKVNEMKATISIDTNSLENTFDYSGVEKDYPEFANVDGISRVDSKRGMGIVYRYYKQNNAYTGDDKLVENEITYEPVDNIISAGKYLVVVGNNIDDNYQIVYDSSCTGHTISTGEPYYSITIVPKTVEITITEAVKVYGDTKESSDVKFNYSEDKPFANMDNAVVFTSDAFAATADAKEYDISYSVSGEGAENYVLVLSQDSLTKFNVVPLEIAYKVGNLTKTYGDEYDLNTITATLIGNQICNDDVVTPVFASEGFGKTAVVNAEGYEVTGSFEGDKKDNYTIRVTGTVKVTKKLLTINRVEPNANLEYDGTRKDVTVVFDGIANDDDPQVVVRYNYKDDIAPIKAGKYYVIVYRVDNTNYQFSQTKNIDCEFEITKRTVQLNILDASIGFGDTSIKYDGNGYTYADGSLTFVDGYKLTFSYVTDPAEVMTNSVGEYNDSITATVDGEDLTNYDIVIAAKGKLTITQKDISTMTLVNSSVEYTGENVIDQIVLDTAGTGCTFVVKDSEGNEVDSIVSVGSYTVVVTGGVGDYSEGTVELPFSIEKATIHSNYLTAEDLLINYNKIKVAGKAEGETIQVSKDGTEWVDSDELSWDITGSVQQQKTIYVKLLENENHKDSEVISVTFTFAYNPNAINEVLDELISKFTFKDIEKYKTMVENYAKVTGTDLSIVDQSKMTKVNDKYNGLMKGAANAVSGARTATGKLTSKTFKVATTAAVSSIGLIVAGSLSILNKKKKRDIL